ncbi:MAG: TonB C-terminal domain-containing protein [Xanthomonadales bacterium]|nr:TonB C-terminal domain-containing protein [Xanthomonadales bacterium]
MAERQSHRNALIGSALLHGVLLLFLLLATLPCASWESFVQRLGLPTWLNPVQCSKPMALPGVAIEATLVGPTAAPKASSHKSRPKHKSTPPPAPPPKTKEPTRKVPVPTLPPPPQHPDVTDQQKAVALAQQAQKAKQLQQQREKQRQSELEAEQAHTDKLLQQLAAIKQKRKALEHKSDLEQQRLQQLADLKKADKTPVAPADVPVAEAAASGQNASDNGLAAQYGAALTNIITHNWLRPDNIPKGVVCPIEIVQIPGGQVISVKVLPTCPFDESGRHSVKNAVLRAQPLPYKGYESVFRRSITLNFKVEK